MKAFTANNSRRPTHWLAQSQGAFLLRINQVAGRIHHQACIEGPAISRLLARWRRNKYDALYHLLFIIVITRAGFDCVPISRASRRFPSYLAADAIAAQIRSTDAVKRP